MDDLVEDERLEDGEDLEETKGEKGGDKEEIKSAKELIQHLTKTTKTLKIYLANNPIHQKFIAELLQRFDRHLTAFGPLRLRVKQFELQCSGQAVYENINRLESLSFHLFIDGIREISFLPGLEKEEIVTFLEALGREGEIDDDSVTVFWEKHFAHIQYVVVEDLKGDTKGVESCREMQTVAPTTDQLQEVYNNEGSFADNRGIDAPKGIELPSLHIFRLTEDEIKKIKWEVQGEEDLDLVAQLQGILFDIIRIERDPGLFAEVLGILDNVLENLIMQGDFIHSRKILEFLWEMADPAKNLPQPLLDHLETALLQAGDSKRILALGTILNDIDPNRFPEFFSLMILFKKNVIAPMVELLAGVEKFRSRRVLCDVLVEIGKMDLDALVSKLSDERWYLVRNVVYILGKIGDAKVVERFSRFVQHKELKVRKEVLHALDAMEDPRAWRLLVQFIADPDLSNRIFAIKSLAKKGVKEAVDPLLGSLSAREFDTKDLYEKKEIFEAIGRIGSDKVVPQMKKYLKPRWSFFKNVKSEEMGLCAVVALQRVGSPAAIEALREGRGAGNKSVREACNKALDVLVRG